MRQRNININFNGSTHTFHYQNEIIKMLKSNSITTLIYWHEISAFPLSYLRFRCAVTQRIWTQYFKMVSWHQQHYTGQVENELGVIIFPSKKKIIICLLMH